MLAVLFGDWDMNMT